MTRNCLRLDFTSLVGVYAEPNPVDTDVIAPPARIAYGEENLMKNLFMSVDEASEMVEIMDMKKNIILQGLQG